MPRTKQPDSKILRASFRVSQEEHQQLHQFADEIGFSFSDTVRLALAAFQAQHADKQQA